MTGYKIAFIACIPPTALANSMKDSGYRERGHYCLYLAIKEFFVKEGKLDPKIAEDLNNCMILREDADYKRKFSQKVASATIDAAERFNKAIKEILRPICRID